MSRFTSENESIANEIITRYPLAKSALIPLLHLAQEQDGWVSNDAMRHISELTNTTPAEVMGTASFYEMFKFHPVGKYVINICSNIACQLLGAETLLEHAEAKLGVKVGGTTADGLFTLEDVECIAACTEAPALQVNYRYRLRVTVEDFDQLIDDIRSGAVTDIPEHGTLSLVRQHIPSDRGAGIVPPDQARDVPVWMARNETAEQN